MPARRGDPLWGLNSSLRKNFQRRVGQATLFTHERRRQRGGDIQRAIFQADEANITFPANRHVERMRSGIVLSGRQLAAHAKMGFAETD